jgi:protein-arginine kinase
MGSIDAINCISLMIMASDMKYIPQSIKYDLNKIMMKSQSAHIQVIEAKPLKQQEIEIKRAEILRKFFATVPDIKFE